MVSVVSVVGKIIKRLLEVDNMTKLYEFPLIDITCPKCGFEFKTQDNDDIYRCPRCGFEDGKVRQDP